MSKTRKLLFTAAMIALPVLILLLLEGGLRLAGLFRPEPLAEVIWQDGHEVYRINQHVARRYFDPRTVTVPGTLPETFAREKSPQTFRIFCLGGSTTAGFPFDGHVSFPMQLRELLSQTYPQMQFEVINLGISAVNSFTVVDVLPEVLELQPDLILIYMGHNEFYGAYGSASTISLPGSDGTVRFFLRLQHLRLVQLLKATISGISGWLAPAATPDNRSLMAAVIRDAAIEYDDPTFRRTRRAFENNLNLLLNACRERQVPVVLSTLVANLADLPPFSADSTSRAMLATGQPAIEVWQQRLARDSTDAAAWYGLGQAHRARGDSLLAALALTRAKDYDRIRFRASEDFNQLIRQTAQAHGSTLLDMQRAFALHSPQGLIGASLICDHLHPNPNGYYLMARAFYAAIRKSGLLRNANPNFVPAPRPYYVTDLDWDMGLLKIFEMVHRWPFPEKPVTFADYQSHGDPKAAEIARHYLFEENVWSAAHYKMADHYISQGEYEKARREYLAVSVFAPDDPYPFFAVAKTYELEQAWPEREHYLRKALPLSPQKGMLIYQIALAEWRQGKLQQASASMVRALDFPDLKREEKMNARFYLAGFLYEGGQARQAAGVLLDILREAPDFAPAQAFLQKIRQEQEQGQ